MVVYEKGTLEDVDIGAWNAVLGRSSLSTVFHTIPWLRAVKQSHHLEETLVIGREGDEPVSVFPFFQNKSYLFHIYGSPVPETGAMYGGPIWIDKRESEPAIIGEFQGKNNMLSIYFLKLPPGYPVHLFKERAYEVEEVPNYILDLRPSAEELWKAISKKARNAVRKAEKSEVQVIEGGPEHLEDYYRLHLETCRRNGLNPLSLRFLKTIAEELYPDKMFKMLLAKHDEEIVAGALFLVHGGTVLYFMGDSRSDSMKLNPSDLIQWRLIQESSESGLSAYDLGGAGIPGITSFKKKWGGVETPFYRAYKGSLITNSLVSIYGLIRKNPLVSKVFRRNL